MDNAKIDWSDGHPPISQDFHAAYFPANGVDASRRDFIGQNQLSARWQSLADGATFTIAETGFGSGLNFLCAWQSWLKYAPSNARLHFISVENQPFTAHDLTRALALFPQLSELTTRLCSQYPAAFIRGFHRLHFDQVQLTLIFDEAKAGLEQLLPITNAGPNIAASAVSWSENSGSHAVDAWFLDGFAPAQNPDMWSEPLLTLIARLSHARTTFSTRITTDTVRGRLEAAGFLTETAAGCAQEHNLVFGHRKTDQIEPLNTSCRPSPSWHLLDRNPCRSNHVVVIGAGLAGCHTAYALAKKGLTVTVIDAEGIGAGASGNAQGIVYAKLSHKPGALTDFNLLSFLYASRLYRTTGLFTKNGDACGALHIAQSPTQQAQYQAIAQAYGKCQFAQWLTPRQASGVAGVDIAHGALYLKQAGWLAPRELCRSLLDTATIALRTHTPIAQLVRDAGQWLLLDHQGNTQLCTDQVVVACAYSANKFEQFQHLPIRAIRGQITHAQANNASKPLATALCGAGYAAPANNGRHCLGATFDLKSTNANLIEADHATNLLHGAALSPSLSELDVDESDSGRVAFRCATPDYLPIVGAAPEAQGMLERFGAYRRNYKTIIDQPGCYWPGLYVNIGHGSRGLTYTPLCGELVASLICGEHLPMGRRGALQLHPARFLMRDLSRNRI